MRCFAALTGALCVIVVGLIFHFFGFDLLALILHFIRRTDVPMPLVFAFGGSFTFIVVMWGFLGRFRIKKIESVEEEIFLPLGIILTSLGIGLHEYFMITQRLHIEGLTECGLAWGLSLILVGVIYALVPRALPTVLMGVLMFLANVGFGTALWILFTAPRSGTIYYQYLYFINWVLLPPWLFINLTGGYYFLKTVKW